MSTGNEQEADLSIEDSEDDESDESNIEDNEGGDDITMLDETMNDLDEEALKALEQQVSGNPYDYQSHVSLVEALRNAGELEKLREARQRFASIFPLTPKLWLTWIKDEKRIDSPWDEICVLFERGVKDYLSVQLWLEYIQTACGNLTPAEMRELCEKALSHAGLHVADGRLLWDAYRVFEFALASAASNSGTIDPASPAAEHLFQIFKRQLSIPLMGAEETRQEFLEIFGDSKFDSAMTQAYKSAIDELRLLSTYEAELESSNHSFEAYKRYLDFEENGCSSVSSSGTSDTGKAKEKRTPNIARLQCLYERAISDHCLNVDLWIRYVNWLDKRFTSTTSIVDVVIPVYERAVRNCSWSSNLWIRYALAYERSGVNNWTERADGVLNRATTEGGYTSAAEASELWLAWAYQKGRAADSEICNYEAATQIFEKGADFLKDKFGDRNWDQTTIYRRSWASYLAFPRKRDSDGITSKPDLPKARALWKDILATDGNGRYASVWLDYYQQIERRLGDMKEARKTLYCALNTVTDFPGYIASALKQFELEEGTLRDLDEAEERIRRHMTRLEERKLQQHALTSSSKQQRRNVGEKESNFRQQKKMDTNSHENPGKRKQIDQHDAPVQPKKPRPEKKERVQLQPPSGAGNRPTIRRPNVQPDAAAHCRTVFVSNLGFNVTEEQLKETFESQGIGNVKDVRLTKLPSGRSKGFGHVEFESVESVAKALALDRYPVDGRPVYISEYKKRGSGGTSTSNQEKMLGMGEKSAAAEKYHFDAGLEKNKLFVRNIPKHATEADLKAIFEPYGELKSVRLVTFTSGQSKGIAYIEYNDEETASKALIKTDGTYLFDKQLSVAISNPPLRRSGFGQFKGTESKFELKDPVKEEAKADSDMMPPPKMLLPRSVAAGGRKPRLNL